MHRAAGNLFGACVLRTTPPHPASASLGHPLPAGERRSSTASPKLAEKQRRFASTAKTSFPQRGEGGRAERRPGEGAYPPTGGNPTASVSLPVYGERFPAGQ